MTAREVAALAGVTLRGLKWMIAVGKGPPSYKSGPFVTFNAAEVADWIRSRAEVTGTSKYRRNPRKRRAVSMQAEHFEMLRDLADRRHAPCSQLVERLIEAEFERCSEVALAAE
jgi:hypothetical protein